MKPWAISDLHVGHPENRWVIQSIRPPTTCRIGLGI